MIGRFCLYFGCSTLLFCCCVGITNGAECTELPRRNITAYLGWPIELSCDNVYDSAYYSAYDDGDDPYDYEWRCTMKYVATNETFHNSTSIDDSEFAKYQHGDITNTTLSEIEIKIEVLGNGGCTTEIVTLNVTHLPYYTCEEHSQDDFFISDQSLSQDGEGYLDCQAQEGNDGRPIFDISEYKIGWCFNCDCTADLLNKISPDGTAITIAPVKYKTHPGVYSCFVTHNGERRYFSVHYVCVKPAKTQKVQMACDSEEVKVKEGENATMTCTIKSDEDEKGRAYSFRFEKVLGKKNNSLDQTKITSTCNSLEATFGKLENAWEDERVSCKLYYEDESPHNLQCFNYTPTEDRWESEKNRTFPSILKMKYTIKNFQLDDGGFYRAWIKVEGGQKSEYNFEFIPTTRDPQNEARIIGICIGSILALLLVIALCVALWVEIRWMWRRQFAKYDTNVKEYGAYVKYYWSRVEEDKVENKNYEYFVNGVKKTLNQINCPTYDTQENIPQYQWDQENISKVQQKCDMIIVILTAEYLTNDQSMFDIYANFLDCTFVFVKTPGVKEAMSEMSNDKKSVLEAAFRRNTVLLWSGHDKNLSGRFKRRLELAMPKRKKEHTDLFYQHDNAQRI